MPDSAFGRLPRGMSSYQSGDDEVGIAVEGRGRGRGAPGNLRHIDAHRAIQADRGIDVSLIGPWIDMVKGPQDSGVQKRWCRVINEGLATATSGTPHSRFLAALPETDGGAASAELEWAVGQGAVGGMLAANPETGTLARNDFASLWAKAETLRVPLVLHPGDFTPPPRLGEHFMVNLVGNPFETTLAAGALMAAGIPESHPDLRIVLVHGGGFLPYQFGRLTAGFARWPSLARLGRRPPEELLRFFFYDTVLFDERPLRFLVDLVGADRVMAGSDCPFTMSDARPFAAPGDLPPEVLGANAARLFNL